MTIGNQQPTSDSNTHRTKTKIALVIFLLTGTAALTVVAQPATGQADIQFGDLAISDVNESVQGDVTDLRASVVADWRYDVPDPERYILRLMVGPSEDNLETIDFVQSETGVSSQSGTVDLEGSILSSSQFSASEFQPAPGGESSQQIVVGVELEVRRANGDPVVSRVVDHVGVTVQDDAVLEAELGGSGSVSVVSG